MTSVLWVKIQSQKHWSNQTRWSKHYLQRLLMHNSQIHQFVDCQLADLTSRGLVNSQTRQVVGWTSRGCHRQLCMLSSRFLAIFLACVLKHILRQWFG